jgi:hypothetical protein
MHLGFAKQAQTTCEKRGLQCRKQKFAGQMHVGGTDFSS